ncbi:MAG TPA: precorrin-2 C(20)-methyltransferase, partial [Rubrobacteraceae bacterium]|nr:precorrin-2 C(20)-methyltransferase [Rubrobacteraceae bacterium]
TCAFATIGDPNVYSTFTHLARRVKQHVPDIQVETVPGITAMQDLAARGGAVLLEGEERLALLPFTAGENALRSALSGFETVVCYKGGSRMWEVLEIAVETGRLEDAIYGSRLGMEGEEVLRAREVVGREGPYLSTLIFTSRGREFG